MQEASPGDISEHERSYVLSPSGEHNTVETVLDVFRERWKTPLKVVAPCWIYSIFNPFPMVKRYFPTGKSVVYENRGPGFCQTNVRAAPSHPLAYNSILITITSAGAFPTGRSFRSCADAMPSVMNDSVFVPKSPTVPCSKT